MGKIRTIVWIIAIPFAFASCKTDAQETKKKPNIVLIMSDDMGFSDLGVMGGEIKTPNLDGLANNGILYTQFYNGARCCPTRASLMTGLYPHQSGMGWMTAADLGTNSYIGELNNNCVTIAEVLKEEGYNTYLSGKWHLIGEHNATMEGDKSAWPLQRGFDRFFGTLLGSGSYYTPHTLADQNTIIEAPEDFYYTDAISDSAVNMIKENKATNAPFFMYVSYTAPHWPLHAPKEDFTPYLETYSVGWDSIRKQRFKRQKELGIIQEHWNMSERPSNVEAWNNVSDSKKEEMKLRMAIYAAQIEIMDRGIGRIIASLKEQGELDNTLIFYLQDNGACAEEIHWKSQDMEDFGTDASFESYLTPWANASNTPFRLFKHWTHEGGIATPLIIHWPEGIAEPGRKSNRPGMLMDIMSTIVDVSEAEYPSEYKGNTIHPMEGESLLSSISNTKDTRDSVMYWEHEANRAIRIGEWKLVLKASHTFPFDGEWELYNLDEDRTETNNLADDYPEKLAEMKALWEEWAKKYKIYPLDNRFWDERIKHPEAIAEKYAELKEK